MKSTVKILNAAIFFLLSISEIHLGYSNSNRDVHEASKIYIIIDFDETDIRI